MTDDELRERCQSLILELRKAQGEIARRKFAASGYAYNQLVRGTDGRLYVVRWYHAETDAFGVRQADGHQLYRLLDRDEIVGGAM